MEDLARKLGEGACTGSGLRIVEFLHLSPYDAHRRLSSQEQVSEAGSRPQNGR